MGNSKSDSPARFLTGLHLSHYLLSGRELQVARCPVEHLDSIPGVSEHTVTRRAKQASHVPCCVVVVDSQLLTASSSSPAYVADASLRLVERLVLLLGKSVPLVDCSAVSGLSAGLQDGLMVRCAPWPRMGSRSTAPFRAVLAETLESSGHSIAVPFWWSCCRAASKAATALVSRAISP